MNNDTLIIVDAGHGGIDSGAVGNGLEEKDLNLQVSKYIYNRLQELDIPSVITRTDDEYLPKDKRIERIKTITKNNPNAILISNHINAGGGEGAEVVYSLKNTPDFALKIIDELGSRGQIKRKVYQRRLPENPNKDYYYILRETNVNEPVLIEYGFIDNKEDSKKLRENLLNYGEGVVQAITDYVGYNYSIPEKADEYIVKRGDTLFSISKKYNMSVDEIKRLNNLTDNIISIGQKLVLSEKNYPNSNYIVQKGDTLWSIAKNNNITVEDLIENNNLTTNQLAIGQELYIPLPNQIIEDGNYDFSNDNKDDFMIYEVQKGDSLFSIATKNDITIPELAEINNLKDYTIYSGQKLLIPKQESNVYIVQKGDTLWSISNKTNKDINEIKEKNNLNSDLLYVGQELII